MNKKQRKRLQLAPITVRILDLRADRVPGAGLKDRATNADYCSGTCTCTNASVWPCRI